MRISLDLSLNVGYKRYRFFKTLPEKGFDFVLNEKDNTIIFNLSLILLQLEVDLIAKKQDCKKDTFGVCGIGRLKRIFVLSIKIIHSIY